LPSNRQTILEYLRGTLFPGITITAGYNNTIKTIERGQRSRTSLGDTDFPAIFIVTSREQRKNITGNQFQANLQVALLCYVKDTKGDPNATGTGVQKDLDRLIEDVTKKLETDRLQGGLVHWTEITDIDTDDGDLMPYAGAVIAVEFQYTTEGIAP
jgi:hypothetical protein